MVYKVYMQTLTILFSRGDEGFRATSRLIDAAKISGSGKRVPAVNIAFDFDISVFSWMSSPDQAWRGARLGKAMQQLHSVANIHVSEGLWS